MTTTRPTPHRLAGIALAALAAVVALLAAPALQAQAPTSPTAVALPNLRIGLAEDPDVLDPTLARSFVGRMVFASMCDKLFDIDEKLTITPQLAEKYSWSADSKALTIELRPGVLFHDGEKLDAAAVKYSLERHKTMPGSQRRGDLAPVTTVEVLGPMTVRINLSAPFAPLLAALSDRAGMVVSPKAAQAAGDKFAAKPVCTGPFKFVERVAQDRIVLERFDGYWNKAAVNFQKVTFTPVPDATVRLANLKSGQFDFIERVAASDIEKLKAEKKFKVATITEIGYQGITINVGKSERSQQNPLGKDARVREAFELSIDRAGLSQVVMDNEALVGNQWVSPASPYYAKSVAIPKRDIAKAKALLAAAGVPKPSFTLLTSTNSDAQRLALVVQAMTREAGFDVKIQSAEFATSLSMNDKGDYEAYVLAWSGRPDPDGNLFSFHGCKQPLNTSGYCDPETDKLLVQSRSERDPALRKKLFEQIAQRINKEKPIVYLYHRNWLWAYNPKLSGVRQVPDGLLRTSGLKLNP